MVEINSENEILCPDCGSNYTHHLSVNVVTRDSEDGPGTSALSTAEGVSISRVDADQIYGRRDVIEITLWCESCGENVQKKKLVINQHKGNTQIQWV